MKTFPLKGFYFVAGVLGVAIGFMSFVPLVLPAGVFVLVSSFIFPIGFILLGNDNTFSRFFDNFFVLNTSVIFIACVYAVRIAVHGL